MSKRVGVFLFIGALAIIAIWLFIAPLYKHTPPDTSIATVVKPTRPLNVKFLRGHWTLVFFGYMKCPEICPRTLNLVQTAWNSFPQNKIPARFVFANLTPTEPESLQDFLSNYHPDFRGLTNDDPDMLYLYKELGIFATDQGTQIDHTAALMLIDPQARISAIFTPPFTAEELVADIKIITK